MKHSLQIGDKVKCIFPTCILNKNEIYTVEDIDDGVIYVTTSLNYGVLVSYNHIDGSEHNRFVKVSTPKSLNDIPTAKAAKAQSDMINIHSTVEYIKDTILNGIKNGKCMVVIKSPYCDIPLNIQEELKDLGYELHPLSDGMMISWY
jgi:hypothetical protein